MVQVLPSTRQLIGIAAVDTTCNGTTSRFGRQRQRSWKVRQTATTSAKATPVAATASSLENNNVLRNSSSIVIPTTKKNDDSDDVYYTASNGKTIFENDHHGNDDDQIVPDQATGTASTTPSSTESSKETWTSPVLVGNATTVTPFTSQESTTTSINKKKRKPRPKKIMNQSHDCQGHYDDCMSSVDLMDTINPLIPSPSPSAATTAKTPLLSSPPVVAHDDDDDDVDDDDDDGSCTTVVKISDASCVSTSTGSESSKVSFEDRGSVVNHILDTSLPGDDAIMLSMMPHEQNDDKVKLISSLDYDEQQKQLIRSNELIESLKKQLVEKEERIGKLTIEVETLQQREQLSFTSSPTDDKVLNNIDSEHHFDKPISDNNAATVNDMEQSQQHKLDQQMKMIESLQQQLEEREVQHNVEILNLQFDLANWKDKVVRLSDELEQLKQQQAQRPSLNIYNGKFLLQSDITVPASSADSKEPQTNGSNKRHRIGDTQQQQSRLESNIGNNRFHKKRTKPIVPPRLLPTNMTYLGVPLRLQPHQSLYLSPNHDIGRIATTSTKASDTALDLKDLNNESRLQQLRIDSNDDDTDTDEEHNNNT